jgi:hypothetical protein
LRPNFTPRLRATVIPARGSYQGTFEFSEYAYHLPHGAACSYVGVDVIREGTEFHASVFQVVEQGYQVAQTAA